MNISQLKAFLGDKPQHLGAENSMQNQLRDAGMRQAINVQQNHVSLNSDTFSSSNALGVRIYSNALNSTLEINQQKPDFSVPEDAEKSLFDFEEVAENVLNFIGGAITNAQNKGADVEELNQLFEQASSGVLKGIALAEQDLAGFLNKDIEDGISQSKSLIEQGIERLKNNIFNPETKTTQQSVDTQNDKVISDIYYAKEQVGDLYIRTKDGDQVRLTFDDMQQFELTQTATQTANAENESVNPSIAKVSGPVESTETPEVSKAQQAENEVPDIQESEITESQSAPTDTIEQTAVYHQERALSFSVKGELDEAELAAIGKLVIDTNELADEFFNGDIETAYNQALELGFDEQELAGFALQLTKVENTQSIKAYETVSRFDEESTDSEPAKAVRPVADYLDKLLNVLEGSRLQLEDSKTYENVVNELINRLGEEVAVPDLISAIHRFNEFNQKLVNNLPIGFQPQA